MNKVNKLIYFIISAIFFVIFDLYFSNLFVNSRINIADNKFLSLMNVQNTGAAFSLLENAPLLLILFAVLAIIIIIVYGVKNIEKFSLFACFWTGMLIAGIGCNLYERLIFGYVRDYFNLEFIDFPIFNISDILINVGVFALIVIIIKNKYLKK